MTKYILRRLLLMIPVALLVTIIIFVLIRMALGHPASAGFTRSDLLTRLYAVDLTDVRKEMMLDGVRAFLACATAASWAAPQAMHVPSRGWAGGAAALTMR